MSSNEKNLDRILSQTLEGIRDEHLDPAVEEAAAARVWMKVGGELDRLAEQPENRPQIRDCSDFQALIPAYLRDGLSDAKAILLKDHLGECVPCRRALKQSRNALRGGASVGTARAERSWVWGAAWKVAAAAAVFIALIGISVQTGVFSIETGGLITIESVEGEVFQINDDGAVPLQGGEQVNFEDAHGIRTGRGASAMLRLEDNSLVEMGERAELAVNNRRAIWERDRGDGVIDLNRGKIIVEASDQGSGQLYVDTEACRVAVTGTVFAVNHGVKGSRVSVIEGEVRVAYSGNEDTLLPGGQTTTNEILAMIPVEDEIAWSRNLERHLALLHEFARIGREIDQVLEGPGLRYSTELLDRAPEGTVIYVGLPNVSTTLGQAYNLMQEKIAGNDLLQQWWDESVAGTDVESELERAMDKIRTFGEQLGDEIAVTMQLGEDGNPRAPLILTRLIDDQTFRALAEAELAELAEATDEMPDVCIVEGTLGADEVPCGAKTGLYLWIHEGYLAVTPEMDGLRRFAGAIQQGGRSAFAASSFHGRLSEMYADGVEWIVALDLENLMRHGPGDSERASLERLGLMDLQHVIAERKETGERAENRAVLTFDQPRRGIAAWLAEPAAMGSMDFVSPDAYFAGGFVMKEPASVVEELFQLLGAEEADFEQSLADFEREHSIDFRRDIAAALGGEFAFALDGPVLPKPSWKLIVEVYDPSRLQNTLEWATGHLNQLLEQEGRKGFAAKQEEAGGRVYHEIESLDVGISVHYTFVDGYMVASASRALLDRSLQLREAGTTLTRSPRFTRLIPHGEEANFSAMVYQNLGSVLSPLARLGEGAARNVSPQAEELLQGLGSMSAPSLVLAYGEPNRIVLVNTSQGGILTSGLTRFLSLNSLLSVQELVGQAVEEERSRSVSDSADAEIGARRTVGVIEG